MVDTPAPAPAANTGEHPAAPTAPWGSEGVWNIGDGEAAKPWYSAISEEPVRQLMEAKAYANPGVLAVAYHNLNKLQNGAGDVIAVPGEGATPEQVKAFNTKLGVPEAPEGYQFKAPEGGQLDPAMVKFGQTFLHSLGVPASKADAAMTAWNAYVAEQTTTAAAQAEADNNAALAALETSWAAKGGLEANRAAGLRVLESINNPELIAKVESQIGAAPLVELLALIGSKSKEAGFQDNPNPTGDPNNPDNMTKAQAQTRIAALQADAAFMAKYNDKNNPEHGNAVKQMEALYARA